MRFAAVVVERHRRLPCTVQHHVVDAGLVQLVVEEQHRFVSKVALLRNVLAFTALQFQTQYILPPLQTLDHRLRVVLSDDVVQFLLHHTADADVVHWNEEEGVLVDVAEVIVGGHRRKDDAPAAHIVYEQSGLRILEGHHRFVHVRIGKGEILLGRRKVEPFAIPLQASFEVGTFGVDAPDFQFLRRQTTVLRAVETAQQTVP